MEIDHHLYEFVSVEYHVQVKPLASFSHTLYTTLEISFPFFPPILIDHSLNGLINYSIMYHLSFFMKKLQIQNREII